MDKIMQIVLTKQSNLMVNVEMSDGFDLQAMSQTSPHPPVRYYYAKTNPGNSKLQSIFC